jgi:hypothetical protein
MEEISKLGCLIEWATEAYELIPCNSCRCCSIQCAKTHASFQHSLWPSSNECWPLILIVWAYLASLCIRAPYCILLSSAYFAQVTSATISFLCWIFLTRPVFITVPRNACLVLKLVLILKRFPIPTIIQYMAWHVLSEKGWLLLYGVTMESINYCAYSLSAGARGSVVGWGTMLHAGRSRVPGNWIFQLT